MPAAGKRNIPGGQCTQLRQQRPVTDHQQMHISGDRLRQQPHGVQQGGQIFFRGNPPYIKQQQRRFDPVAFPHFVRAFRR
ncbi:hypothetical protein D3C73_1318280 [compost metagenome]